MPKIVMRPYYFQHNPIVATFEVPSRGVDYAYEVKHDLEVLYTGRITSFQKTMKVSLNGLFDRQLNNAPRATYQLLLYYTEPSHTPTASHNFVVYRGGIPLRRYHELKKYDKDIFDLLLSPAGSFFLSSRYLPNGVLPIAENELMPLYFIPQQKVFSVKIKGRTVKVIDTRSSQEALATLDIATIREEYWNVTKELINVIDISVNSVIQTTVVITQATPSRYALLYQNRYGVMERVALTDYLQVQRSSEGKTIQHLDLSDDLLHKIEIEKAIEERITGTLPITAQAKELLDDLYTSPLCYLMIEESAYRVNISLKEQVTYADDLSPRVLTIEMTPSDYTQAPEGDFYVELPPIVKPPIRRGGSSAT